MATISKEDVIDAIDDLSEERLDLLSEYWFALNEDVDGSIDKMVTNTITCAKMLYSAKAYQDVLDWLDAIENEIAEQYGAESDHMTAFMEDPELEDLKMNALDHSGLEEDEEDDVDEE